MSRSPPQSEPALQRNRDLYLVVMAGGSGTRFWPKSTSKRPKQLLSFGREGGATLLAETLARFDGLVPRSQRMIVTTQSLQDAVAESAPGVEVLAEPQGRNTAPCVYWAARAVAARDPKGVMLVMPSDHYIPRLKDFQATVAKAAEWARTRDDLVTLGVKPDRAETGYGYLKLGSLAEARDEAGSSGKARAPMLARRVEAFVEKPDLPRAKQFVSSGQYLWNGGMFLWRADVILKAFDQHMPEMRRAWEAAKGQVDDAYPQMTATSIDFGVMEKASNVVTFPLDCGWDDLGSWTSLENVADDLGTRDAGGVVMGGKLLAADSSGNIVDAPGKLVAVLGASDLIVVVQGDAVLVASKDRAQDIRKIVDLVKKTRPELA